ncbi:hypothetical protein AmyhaDRAFT_0316 [Haloechinothrix halophila YIM 93223]|uniref:Uncharacterized protein n=2 Tax=Haloechinothrix TaxID=1425377 RepID=W9DT31_9PSEU|nr:hypothetical protein AmyhaDRAFT_0316 [Haloechinothrix halophila YIM 93223]
MIRPSGRALAWLLVICVAAVSATGCSGENGATDLPPMPQGATEPFDLYLQRESDLIVEVMHVLTDRCLADAGFSARRDSVDESELENGPLMGKPLQPRTVERARKYGFGMPLKPRQGEPRKVVDDDPARSRAYDECMAKAKERLGGAEGFEEVVGQYGNLRNTLTHEMNDEADEILSKFASKLTECLREKGYERADGGDLDAEEGPRQFGISTGSYTRGEAGEHAEAGDGAAGLPEQVAYVPTTEESDFAVTFVRCGQRTGVFAEVDERWEGMQQAIIEDHAAEFAELNPKIKVLAKKAAGLVGK